MSKKDTLKDFIKSAAKAFAKATLNIQRFANCYVNARITFADDESSVIEAFKAAYPMFGDREWRRFWMVGNHILLPQFMFKSDAFVGKLLKLEDHMKWQQALVSASEDGKLLVDRGNGPEKVTLADLTKKEERTLAILLNEKDAELSPTMLIEKFSGMVRQVNKSKSKGPAWEIEPAEDLPNGVEGVEEIDGKVSCIRFKRGKYGKREIQQVLKALKLNWADKCTTTKSATEMMREMAYEIVKLNDLRDEEWEYCDENGPKDGWNYRTVQGYDKILKGIYASRKKLTKMVREVTGDNSLSV